MMFLEKLRLNSIISSIFKTGLLKGLALVASFVFTLVITRTLGAEQSGYFLLGLALLTAFSGILRLGLDSFLLRTVSASDFDLDTQRVVNMAVLAVLVLSIATGFLVWSFREYISLEVFGKSNFESVLTLFGFALPFVAVTYLYSFLFQGRGKFSLAAVMQNLGLLCFCIFTILSSVKLGLIESNAASYAAIYLMSAFLMFLLSLWFWYSAKDAVYVCGKFLDRSVWVPCANLWVATSMTLAVQWGGVLIAGVFVDSSELAYLSAAQRTAMLISFALVVVNMVVAPHYARLWKVRDLVGMKRLSHLSVGAVILLVLPAIALLVSFSESIMQLYGPGFEKGAILLQIMVVGQFVNVATGSVGYLLNMSGHERDLRNISVMSGCLVLVGGWFMISRYGVLGAAYATALGVALQNVFAFGMVKRRLGFWPIGFG